jgi:hypothetical protein
MFLNTRRFSDDCTEVLLQARAGPLRLLLMGLNNPLGQLTDLDFSHKPKSGS